MNKLFIIGNGFDLAHGLKTSYCDFILWLFNQIIEDPHNKKYEDLYQIERSFPKVEKINTLTELKDYQYFDSYLQYKNNFIRRTIEKASVSNWVDIEYQYYYDILYRLKMSHNAFSEYLEDGTINLNKSFRTLRILLIKYLNSIDLNINIINDIENHIQSEIYYKNIGADDEFFFLNFNYTSTIKNYLDHSNKNIILNNIHGELSDLNNPIIFGYGDEMDSNYSLLESFNSNEFLENMKSFSYLLTENYQNLDNFIHNYEYEVCIMGHSCGISDRVLLNNILENTNCKKIKLYYYQKDENTNDYFQKTQEISRHFNSNNKHKMRTIIVPFEKSVPLVSFSRSTND